MYIPMKSKGLMAVIAIIVFLMVARAANAAGKIYVTNRGSATVEATVSGANLDGTGGESLGNSLASGAFLSGPRSIALNTATGKMYVTNDNATVTVAFLDGTGAVSLNYPSPLYTYFDTGDIALDTVAGKMYITDFWALIYTSNLDGTGMNSLGNLAGTLNNDGLTPPYGIALHMSKERCTLNGIRSATWCAWRTWTAREEVALAAKRHMKQPIRHSA